MHNQKITLTTIVEVIIREEELLVVIKIFTENANLTENQNLHSSSSCNCFGWYSKYIPKFGNKI